MEATAPANLFYAAFLFLSVLYLAVTRRRTSRLPPGPTGLPLVGSLPFLDRNLHACFAGLAAKYGPVFAIRLGSKVEIVVTSPELAHEVLRDKDPVFSNRVIPDAGRAVAFDGVENIVGVPVGPKWRLLRRLCAQEMLSPAGLDSLYGLRRREFRSTLRYLYSQSQAGEPVDLGALMFVNMMNVVTSTLWGGTIGSESERAAIGKEFRALVAKLTELLGTPNLSDFFPVLAPFDLQGVRKKMERIRVRFDQIFDKIIQQRVNAQQDGSKMATDFLECMLKMEREGGDGKATFTMTDVKSLLLDMVVAGTETMSNTVEWAIAEMLQKPEVLRKVQEELDKVVSRDAIVEESQLPELRYLRMVIKETLRLHPALPLMVPHSPSEESTIGGFHVPAGCRVFVNVWAIHRNPLVWSEPLEFNPERFSGDDDGRRWDFTGRQFDYLPFGSGRRICAGIAMADKMTTYSLAMLLQAFDWKLPQGTELDLSEKFGVVMKKATPLMVIPKSRFPKPDLYCS
ncbi:flavonoid 3',5'-hydroxylase CYP75B138 [Zea mays]|uniref:Cytochrome P450 family 706 subfamily A polypeptide 5 n=1 Tax=Zea mays TaxID=4577 RepID=A0A1D6MKN4_MAIZE|nr:flavonoid 3',5'-hydroxylase CYP75B138 [Zea mays]ONM29773.1 cytochrome P450 family 706 subfamily A polypeptide 5 [Zea mays]|eukprot:XP_008673660.1 flavonoid 3',5'-hydroxylase [Zea mays]